jgi:hypothetical protein
VRQSEVDVSHSLASSYDADPRSMDEVLDSVFVRDLSDTIAEGVASTAPGFAPGLVSLPRPRFATGLLIVCGLGILFLAALLVVKSRCGAAYGLVPAAVLAVSTVLSIVTYFAARDWFWSFLSGDYAGVGYLMLVGSVAMLLADILWNHARIVKAVLRLFWWIPV